MRRRLVLGLALPHATRPHNLLISCLQVWIRIHTYSILAGGEHFVSLALCYGQRHPRYIECSPIN
jgi:hypothetical protein